MTNPQGGPSFRRSAEGVGFWIHVSPRSRRSQVGGIQGDALRVSVVEPPVEGAANAGCARALASAFGVRRSEVELDPASKGRRKRVVVRGETEALVRRLLELAGA